MWRTSRFCLLCISAWMTVGALHAGPAKPVALAAQHAETDMLDRQESWLLMAAWIGLIAFNLAREDLQPKTGKESRQSLLFAAFTASALITSMMCWGVAQEYMMTHVYESPGAMPQTMPSSLFLSFANRLLAVLASFVCLRWRNTPCIFPGMWKTSLPSLSNTFASWSQYQSLRYVSFPFQTACKSCKLLPVLLLSSLRGKRHSFADYMEATIVVAAMFIFGSETEDGTSYPSDTRWLGIALIVALLISDSVTPHLQDSLLQEYPQMTPLQMSFSMSLSSAVLFFVLLLLTSEMSLSFQFFREFPEAWLQVTVLSMCSALTQFLIPFTIRHFGPVTFVVIMTARQLLSVLLSSVLFRHYISSVAWFAAALGFGMVVLRAFRTGDPGERRPTEEEDDGAHLPLQARLPVGSTMDSLLLRCGLGMHISLGVYSLAQEYMATHDWDGHKFRYTMFILALNRSAATMLGVYLMKREGLSVLRWENINALFPASFNLSGTYCQYLALHHLAYPIQSLLKSMKIIPVMIFGQVLGTRRYGWLNYVEAVLITFLVGFFTYIYRPTAAESHEVVSPHLGLGLLLMFGYISFDSMTSNAEDYLYQTREIDPKCLLLGMNAMAGLLSWFFVITSGELFDAFRFVAEHNVWLPLAVLAMAEAFGAYSCTLTVRYFGPAVFTLILMSHQILSIVLSCFVFEHQLSLPGALSLGSVAILSMLSSLRQMQTEKLNATKL